MGKKTMIVLLGLVGMMSLINPAYSQEAVAASVEGEIVSVDVEGAMVVVKKLVDPATETYEEVTLAVSPEATIQEGETSLGLTDLEVGDQVVIATSSEAAGEATAQSITVK